MVTGQKVSPFCLYYPLFSPVHSTDDDSLRGDDDLPDLALVELRPSAEVESVFVRVRLHGDVEVHELRHLRQPLGGRIGHRLEAGREAKCYLTLS